MDLKDFVSTTVLSIHDAVIDIEKNGGGKYEIGADTKRKQGVDHGTIHFNVAVTAGKQKSASGQGKGKANFIHVVSIEGDAEASLNTKDESTSRIAFDLVLQRVQTRQPSSIEW